MIEEWSVYQGILFDKARKKALSSFNFRFCTVQAPVVRRLDNAICWINLYPVDSVVYFSIIYRWIAIYPLDNVIRPLYDWAQLSSSMRMILTVIYKIPCNFNFRWEVHCGHATLVVEPRKKCQSHRKEVVWTYKVSRKLYSCSPPPQMIVNPGTKAYFHWIVPGNSCG